MPLPARHEDFLPHRRRTSIRLSRRLPVIGCLDATRPQVRGSWAPWIELDGIGC
jgi:hypothetical protein